MAVYTAHEPPPNRDGKPAAPERFEFVRDGFSFWAFLLGPFWMLRHRMWLAFFGFVAVVAAIEFALRRLGLSGDVSVIVGLLLALLIGFEAGTLRRFTLARRKWENAGVVVGDDRESAERRFFDIWARRENQAYGVADETLRSRLASVSSPLRRQAAEPFLIDPLPPAETPR
ncbi:MAG TPA: DUF2628 domain-containing protein [Xanthobacteraceae bacterium]|jgi:hypothetical protein|nr:DUF2628 domain-containing protein [Xanthobacteraceae bacterium]